MKVGQVVAVSAFGLAIGLATSCKEPVQSGLLAPSKPADTWAPSPGSIVIVRQAPAPEVGNVFNTLQSALAHVDPGGVILLSDGRHKVGGFDVPISVTLAPLPGAHPVLDAQHDYSAFVIRGTGDPITVTVSGLTFENASGSPIQIIGPVGRVTIAGSQFSIPSSGGCCLAGVFIFEATGGPVVFVNDRFVGGDVGVASHDFPGDVIIAANNFSGQNWPIHTGGGTLDGRVFVIGNRVSNCGQSCIAMFGSGAKDVRYNFVTDNGLQPTNYGIWVAGGSARLEDNVVVGGILPPGDPAGTYSFAQGALGFRIVNATARRNELRNAPAGLWLDESSVEASDLLIDHVTGAFGGWGPANGNTLSLRHSNITNYTTADGVFFGTYSFAAIDARCNWWGIASGPVNTGPNPPAQYFPWATSPIAGTGRSC